MSPKWSRISSINFNRTVRKVCLPHERIEFIAGRIGFCCFKCKKNYPLKTCPCGNNEYIIKTFTGNIGLYCTTCNNGFTSYRCPCGASYRIESTIIREISPETAIGKLFIFFSKLLLIPFHTLYLLIVVPSRKCLSALTHLSKSMDAKLEEIRIKGEQSKEQIETANKWTDVYFQRDPDWIGKGFPLRAIGELKSAAKAGNQYAVQCLENIFDLETDTGKRAETALALKEATGKDYMPEEQVKKGLRLTRMHKGPLPKAPDYLP